MDTFALLVSAAISSAVTLPIDNIRMRMIQLHKQKEGIRINFSPIHQTIAKSLEVETHPLLLWAGYYTFFPQMFVHAYLMGGSRMLSRRVGRGRMYFWSGKFDDGYIAL